MDSGHVVFLCSDIDLILRSGHQSLKVERFIHKFILHHWGGREGGREEEREEEREGGRKRGREGGREGGREEER